MPTYKTPNVYVEEIPTLAPSVVPVATAVPAFIGYTEKAGTAGEYVNQPIRLSSILDYTNLFGGAAPTTFTIAVETVEGSDQISQVTAANADSEPPEYLMYYALRLFFDNGGGSCYVVSIGDYSSSPAKADFQTGLAALRKEDEPTLILLTDAIHLLPADYYELCQNALKQCNDLKDRFAIFDVLASDRDTNGIGANFRQNIGTESLKYGATYYPYLQTSLNYEYTEDSVALSTGEGETGGQYETNEGLLVTYAGPASNNPRVQITLPNKTNISFDLANNLLIIKLPDAGATVGAIVEEWAKRSPATNASFALEASGPDDAQITEPLPETPLVFAAATTLSSAEIKTQKTDLYNKIKTAIGAKRVVMPPSAAVAGVYAKTDRDRGVWKAPANVSLATVLGPMEKVTNEEQENLNVDATAGKSINAIRSFTGKGTLIWGARTLAGNDNEWRYIPVRRLFNLIEESIQKATNFVVFESNNAVTWLKVKTIIESYLDGLWRQGALAGNSKEEAYYVNVGLGQTMTADDILEGRMIIEIGVSAVRPAEFIILRFSHKLQEA